MSDLKQQEPQRRNGRDKVTNGKRFLPDVDGRSHIARRYRAITRAIVIDQGGDQISESRLQLIRRFAASAVLAEQMEAQLAAGQQIDINEHALLISSMVRVANKIGINRTPKDLGPTLGDVLREGVSS